MDRNALFTATPIARRIALAAGLDSPEAVLRSLRKLMASNTIVASIVPQASGTAPNLFDEPGVYRAALALRLSRVGLTDEMVRAALPFMRYEEGERADSEFLWEPIEDLASRPYYFHLFMVPDYFAAPGDVQFGTFSEHRDGGFVHPSGAEAWITTITIPLRGLVGSLTERDEPHDGQLGPAR